jgi:hypothetical protein
MRKKAPAAAKPRRQRNAKNADDESPVDYMLRVMRDPKAPASRRDTMAKSVTSYVHAKPEAKKKKQNGEAGLKRRLEKARETLASKIAGLRSDCE